MDSNLVALRDFRDDLYGCLYRRADALFELTDALLTAGALPSPVHLSGEPLHRRGWGSLYAALTHGRLDETGLRAMLSCHPLLPDGQPVFAVDCSTWARWLRAIRRAPRRPYGLIRRSAATELQRR